VLRPTKNRPRDLQPHPAMGDGPTKVPSAPPRGAEVGHVAALDSLIEKTEC
jgi:hypothetical protein